MSTGADEVHPIRVLIADDDPLVRAGLRMMLAGTPDIQVVGEATDGDEVAAAVGAHAPDVVLMDIRMPRMDGLRATEQLLTRPHPPRIVVLTTFQADEYVLRALRAGASGFLLKDTPPADIAQAIRSAASGEPTLSPAAIRTLIEHVSDGGAEDRTAGARERLDQLSDREREVAVALGRGRSNAEIAAQLYMSVATVKAHVSRVMTKLDLDNRVQIALLAHDAGLT